MRVLAVLILIFALPALAIRQRNPEQQRYIDESMRICMERTTFHGLRTCEEALLGGTYLYIMEMDGMFSEAEFALDSRDRDELRLIAKTCRELTLDGGLIDGYMATVCVAETVRERNRVRRRAERMEEQRQKTVAIGTSEAFDDVSISVSKTWSSHGYGYAFVTIENDSTERIGTPLVDCAAIDGGGIRLGTTQRAIPINLGPGESRSK